MALAQDQSWAASAACRQEHPDVLFVRGAAQRSARELCFNCPVRQACLVEALTENIEFGVWGGLTERERRALLKRHPAVTDWKTWLTEHPDEAGGTARRAARARTLTA